MIYLVFLPSLSSSYSVTHSGATAALWDAGKLAYSSAVLRTDHGDRYQMRCVGRKFSYPVLLLFEGC